MYTGTCGALVPADCNEDGPNATATTYPAGLTIATTIGTVYYLMVDGFNFNGTLANGEYCVLVKKVSGVGIKENAYNASIGLTIYPSPANETVSLQYNSLTKGNTVVTITDITGREMRKNTLISSTGKNTLSIDVRTIASGVYWITLQDEQGSRTAKFLKK